MLYAIVESGGKQYRAVENSAIEVDRLQVEAGQSLTLDKVLLVADDDKANVGAPYISGVKVGTTVIGHVKGPKLVIFKYEPKKRIRKKTGHRQEYTRLLVNSIEFEGKTAETETSKSINEKPIAEKPTKKRTLAKPITKAAEKAAEKTKKPAAKKAS
jgi:large subunit ribosomal protein L21